MRWPAACAAAALTCAAWRLVAAADAAPPAGQITVVESARSTIPAIGAEYRELAVVWRSDVGTKAEFTVRCVTMAPGSFRARIADEPMMQFAKARPVELLARTTGAAVAVNGGYFALDFAPVGLCVAAGATISPALERAPLSAVLGIDATGALHIDPAASAGTYPDAIQCGPLLIDPGGGSGIRHDSPEVVARRTCIALSSTGQVVVVSTSPVSLFELADVLARAPAALGAAAIDRAINLDGGPSTALYAAAASGEVRVAEEWPVRNVVLFSARPPAPATGSDR